MPIVFHCPGCQTQFRTDEAFAGRPWRCPKCSANFTIPEAEVVMTEVTEVTAEPPRPARRPPPRRDEEREERADRDDGPDLSLAPEWWTVRVGLRLLGTGLGILLVAFVVFLAAQVLVWVKSEQAVFGGGRAGAGLEGNFLIGATLTLVLGMIAAVIIWLIGQAMCCSAVGGAKGLAIGSLVSTVICLLTVLIAVALVIFGTVRPFDPFFRGSALALFLILSVMGGITFLAANILLVIFLRLVAGRFHNPSLAWNTIIFLIVSIAWVVGEFVFNLTFGWQRVGVKGGLVVYLIEAIVAMLLACWLLFLLSAARSTIPRPEYVDRRSRGYSRPPSRRERRDRYEDEEGDEYDEDDRPRRRDRPR